MTIEQTINEDLFKQMEARLTDEIRNAAQGLEARLWPLTIAEIGLENFREQCIKEAKVTHDPVILWHARIAQDPEITHPQRKIMDRLLDRFDPQTGEFRPLQFSKLVREARVGKGRTQEYLAALDKKGLIRSWSDGYRRLVAVRHES